MIGHLFGDHDSSPFDLSSRERDILRLALRLDRSIKLADVRALLDCGYDTARKQLILLENKKWLFPEGKGTARTHSWRVDPTHNHPYCKGNSVVGVAVVELL